VKDQRWDCPTGRHRGWAGVVEGCPIPGNSSGVPGLTPHTPGEAEIENSPLNKVQGPGGKRLRGGKFQTTSF